MIDTSTSTILAALSFVPTDEAFFIRIKFLDHVEVKEEWVVVDEHDPVKTEHRKGKKMVEILRNTKPGLLTGIDKPYYGNDYQVVSVVYGFYPIRDPDRDNLAPLREGYLNCVFQSLYDQFKNASRGKGLSKARRQKLKTVATIYDVEALEKFSSVQLSQRTYPAVTFTTVDTIALWWGGAAIELTMATRGLKTYNIPRSVSDAALGTLRAKPGTPFSRLRKRSLRQFGFLAAETKYKMDPKLVDQFVLADDRCFRTRENNLPIIAAYNKYTDNSDELATKVFRKASAAASFTRELRRFFCRNDMTSWNDCQHKCECQISGNRGIGQNN